MSGSPWSGLYTSQLPALNNRHRLRQIREFLGDGIAPVNSLDIGAKNYISQELGIAENTHGDLNISVNAPSCDYSLITCLEVLNHIQQDLTLLKGIHALLRPKGRLILSTPRLGLIAYSHGIGNYKELKERNVIKLLEYCGFKVLRKKVYRSYPFSFCFYGFLQPLRFFKPFKGDTLFHKGAPERSWKYFGLRPILKFLLHKYVIIEAEKI